MAVIYIVFVLQKLEMLYILFVLKTLDFSILFALYV